MTTTQQDRYYIVLENGHKLLHLTQLLNAPLTAIQLECCRMENVILIIDDDPATVDALAALFLQHGWLVQRALSGSDGLASAQHYLPSVVVSDLAMPGISGYDVAEKMRAIYGLQCPLLIAVTGWTDSDVAKQALEAGFSFVITKPVDFQSLLSTIELGAPSPEIAGPLCMISAHEH